MWTARLELGGAPAEGQSQGHRIGPCRRAAAVDWQQGSTATAERSTSKHGHAHTLCAAGTEA